MLLNAADVGEPEEPDSAKDVSTSASLSLLETTRRIVLKDRDLYEKVC